MIKKMIPNIITFLNLFCGFYAIYASFSGDIGWAALAIMLATVFDMLDGRIARMLGVFSEMGKELDSFSDLITFGLAPSLLFFNFVKISQLNISPILLLILSFVYLITAASRLALYNTKTESPGTSSYVFSGMPSTFAGISIAAILGFNYIPSLVDKWLGISFPFSMPHWMIYIYIGMFLLYAFLMVTKIRYTKASRMVLNFKSFWTILYNIGLVLFLIFALKYFILIMALTYTISPLWTQKHA